MSSVRSKYCGHNCSCEFTCSTPTDAHKLPTPETPRCLAPQGTDCMLSSMPLLPFLSFPTETEEAINSMESTANNDPLTFITPPRAGDGTGGCYTSNSVFVQAAVPTDLGSTWVLSSSALPWCQQPGYRSAVPSSSSSLPADSPTTAGSSQDAPSSTHPVRDDLCGIPDCSLTRGPSAVRWQRRSARLGSGQSS